VSILHEQEEKNANFFANSPLAELAESDYGDLKSKSPEKVSLQQQNV